jgi:hypothetical protein
LKTIIFEPKENIMEMNEGTSLFVYIEAVGTLVGLGLIIMLYRVSKGLGGAVGSAVKSLTLGVVLFTVAFGTSSALDYFNITSMTDSMALHMTLMVFAMIMVVVTATRFAKLLI